MNNARVQQWLSARVRAEEPTALEREAGEIISWLFSSSGAVALADEAAWELVCSECRAEEDGGCTWWRTHPTLTVLLLDDMAREIAEKVSKALQYLAARQILQLHPTDTRLVRMS